MIGEIVLSFLANMLPSDFVRSDPVLMAYKEAVRAQQQGVVVDRAWLIGAMKRTGVPGIYTDPYADQTRMALDAWQRGESLKTVRRELRLLRRSSKR